MADRNMERMLALLHSQVFDSRLLFLSRYETVDRLLITHLMADGNTERMLALLHPQVIDRRLLFLSRYEPHVDR